MRLKSLATGAAVVAVAAATTVATVAPANASSPLPRAANDGGYDLIITAPGGLGVGVEVTELTNTLCYVASNCAVREWQTFQPTWLGGVSGNTSNVQNVWHGEAGWARTKRAAKTAINETARNWAGGLDGNSGSVSVMNKKNKQIVCQTFSSYDAIGTVYVFENQCLGRKGKKIAYYDAQVNNLAIGDNGAAPGTVAPTFPTTKGTMTMPSDASPGEVTRAVNRTLKDDYSSAPTLIQWA